MFPLLKKEIGGYGFRAKTSYSSAHLGVDYRCNNDNLFAPFDGFIKRMDGTQGGITLWFYPHDTKPFKVARLMHLSKVIKTGEVKEGDLIAITGNTGSLSTAPHLHLDISKTDQGTFWDNINNFIDPESIDWDTMIDKKYWENNRYVNNGTIYLQCTAEFFNTYIGDYNGIKPTDFGVSAAVAPLNKQITDLTEKLKACNSKPPIEIVKTVEKIVPVEVPVNITTDEEKAEFIKEYEKNHPPVVIEKIITQEIKVGRFLSLLWEAIKNIKVK
jgi:murein DD-endopeptidase MepM/ murein hydrolase activator NlpD